MNFQELSEKIGLMSYEDAIDYLTEIINRTPKATDALTLRRMKYFGAGRRSAAINDYLAALRIDPECKAKLALQSANSILDYYNKDLYNP